MCCTPQTTLNRKQTKKQVIAIAFLVCFIVVSLLSEVFILTRVDHTHDHNGVGVTCATCAQMQNAENLLKQLGMAATGSLFVLTGLFATSTIRRAISSHIATLTPVMRKIRMNN